MKVVKFIALAALLGLLLYISVYLIAGRSDAFVFAENAIKHSKSLQTKIGNVERVRLPLFGSYDENFVNGDTWVTMEVEVTGAVKTVALQIKMKKINATWAIEQSLIDGNPVVL